MGRSIAARADLGRAWRIRLSRLLSLILFLGLLVWTGLILLTPHLPFEVDLPGARVSIEAAGSVVLALTCALAYLRFWFSRQETALVIALAFVLLAVNNFVFGVVLSPSRVAVTIEQQTYLLAVGHLVAGMVLLYGIMTKHAARERGSPAVAFSLGSVAVLGILAIVQVLAWRYRGSLPALTADGGTSLPEVSLATLTPVGLVLGGAGTILFLMVAALLLVREEDEAFRWLPIAFILAAFSHLHQVAFPAAFVDRISSGDFLRLAFGGVLLAALMIEMHRLYSDERKRGRELEHAYQAERRRVEELEDLDRARAELFGVLTHELMHPVAAIRGFSVTLSQRWDNLDDDARRAMVDRLDRESSRLRDFCEEAVSASALDAGGFLLVKRPEQPGDLVFDAAEAVGDLNGRLHVRVDPVLWNGTIQVDRTRILQVLRNLLSNAEKYSEPETPIELRAANGDGHIRFTVLNEGPGISPEEMPRLFQRFSRIRPRGKEDVPGSGLGLYITRRIVEDHGGQIWVENERDGRTAFIFTIPVGAEA